MAGLPNQECRFWGVLSRPPGLNKNDGILYNPKSSGVGRGVARRMFMPKLSEKQKANIERFKQHGTKVPPRMRREILQAKTSWWTEPDFLKAQAREADRIKHNTQGVNAPDSF